MEIHPDADEFLRARLWGLLATGRASGTPQLSMVAYDWNGSDLAISCRSTAAKFVNAQRRPDVVFVVADGIDTCTVTGVARCDETGDRRDQLTERVRDRLRCDAEWAARILDADMESGLDEVSRATIVIEATSVSLLRPLG